MRYYLLISPLLLVVFVLDGSVQGRTPAVVDVGAVFTFNSIIGKSARVAMDAAVSDVNADPTILNQTVLRLKMEDIECNALMGVIKTFGVLQEEVVAMIGPQSSTLAHMVSEIVDGLQVPLVSYAATDPTLSALQFPFFLRTIQSDSVQMAAMADLIDFYEWREVIAVFEDNEHGRNGISSLEDELHKKMSKIAYKLRLPSRFDTRDVEDLLNRSKLYGPRVYVVHMSPDPNIKVFTIAHDLQMMTKDYVWLATDWLCTSLDSLVPPNRTLLRSLRGVVGLRQYIPLPRQKAFLSRMKKMQQNGLAGSGMNRYGIYAYDSVWAVAFAIDKYLKEHGNITFFSSNQLHGIASGKFRVFGGGILLRKKLLQTNFTGLSGPVHFNSERSLAGGSYEIININQATTHRVGYWSNFSGLAVSAPVAWQDQQSRSFLQHQQLQNVTWPGGVTEKPRGWVIAEKEKPLRVGVPNRASFVGFATESLRTHKMEGYCLEIFKEALKIVPYNIPYRFEAFGNGTSNPSYDELAKKVSDNVFDAAVGDIAIVTNRTKVVDFSQPYIATGLVIVVPIDNKTSNVWVFLKPFTVELWCVTAASFVIIAVVIWILEHRVNDDFRGPPKRQLITMFLFSLSTLFKTNQEDTVSPLGRMVMVVWLFLLLVITSSYTASLTSILTVGQLSSSSITGVESLIVSRLPIGYQVGSFAHNYLTETLNIHRSRLIALGSPEAYETALRKGPGDGGVAAIVDELPYVELFLSMHTDFGIVGQPFTRNGWGFAFQRDSPLAIDMSTAILKLSESGMLQEIHNKWFCKAGCPGERRKEVEADQLHISSFWGLYLLCGTFSVTALLVFLVQTLRQFLRYKRAQRKTIQGEQPHTVCLDAVYGFVDFIDRKEEAIRQYFSQNDEMGSVSGVVQNP